MTTAQKIIKNLAIAFAIFLIIIIISTILGVIYGLANVLGLKNQENQIIGQMNELSIENNEINRLDIEIAFTNLSIKTGDSLKVETDNSNITCRENNHTLQIKEKSKNWFSNNQEGDIVLYLPEELALEEVEINAGAGKISIENLNAKKLELELGAGETEINNIKITQNCSIDSGAGRVNILSGFMQNLDLDMGVGEVNLTAMLEGKSDMDAGIGNLNITLQGDKETYQIRTEKGLGKIQIDGKEAEDRQIFGEGENYMEIDGGVGNIEIKFDENRSTTEI